MIERRLLKRIVRDLAIEPAVALLGPRQVGKTTLALAIAAQRHSIYVDLEQSAERAKLAEPVLYLSSLKDRLVVLDEIQNVPALFQTLRGLIDSGRRQGRKTGRFLLLGSASLDLLRQTGESLAGRIAYRELGPLDLLEVGAEQLDRLWLRGGFPESFLAANDADSLDRRLNFIRSYLTRDIPAFNPRLPIETLRRFWTMLAHNQGALLNASRLASGLSVSAPAVARYVDLLVDLLLVRRLQPFHSNVGKRLVKSPKTYIRDSGVLHALLGIGDRETLLGHPVLGASWEGFVIETLIACAPPTAIPFFYRTVRGAEIDLLFEMPGGALWAIEIKRGLAPKVERGFHTACEDIAPTRRLIVYSGQERFPLPHGIQATSLAELAAELASLQA
jgi:uncharacterized protein